LAEAFEDFDKRKGVIASSEPLNPKISNEYRMQEEDEGQLDEALAELKTMIEEKKPVDFSATIEGLSREAEHREGLMAASFKKLQNLAAKREGLKLKFEDENLPITERIIAISGIRRMEDERNLTDRFLSEELAAYNARKEEAGRLAELATETGKQKDEDAISLKNLLRLRGEEAKHKEEYENDLGVLVGGGSYTERKDITHKDFVEEQSKALEVSESIIRMNEVALLAEKQQEERINLWGRLRDLFGKKKESNKETSGGVRMEKMAEEFEVPLSKKGKEKADRRSTKEFVDSFGPGLSDKEDGGAVEEKKAA